MFSLSLSTGVSSFVEEIPRSPFFENNVLLAALGHIYKADHSLHRATEPNA